MVPSRINARKLLLVLLGLAVLMAGLYVGNRLQLRRQAQAMRDRIDQQVAAGDTATAIADLERYLAIRPGDGGRLAQLARLLAERVFAGEADERQVALCRDVLRASVARMPDDSGLRESWALFQLAAGDAAAALPHFEILYDKQAAGGDDRGPKDRLGLLLAKAALTAGKGQLAEETLQGLIGPQGTANGSPAPREAYAALAMLLAEGRRQPKAAEDVLARMVADWPDDAEGWVMQAEWLRRSGKLEEAAQSVERARTLAPLDSKAALVEAMVALARGDAERAAAIVAEPALADAPPSEMLVTVRADVAASKRDIEATMEILRRGIEAFPESGEIVGQALSVATDAGRIDDLRALLPGARERLGADAAAVRYAEAMVAMAEERWVAALKSWELAREKLADNPIIATRIDRAMALCHAALGQTDKAAEARRRATEDDPRSIDAIVLEAQSLEETGRPTEALALLERVATTIPADALPTRPGVWQPLLRLRIADVARRPETERDWTKVDALLEAIGRADGVPERVRESFRILVLEAKGQEAEAAAAAEAAVASRPDDAAAAARLLKVFAVSGREAEALERTASWPAAVRHSVEVMAAEAELAMRLPGARSDAWLAEVTRGLESLEGPREVAMQRRLMVVEAVRGRPSAAERIGERIVSIEPDDLPVRQLLVDLAVERGDAEVVGTQASEIERLAGADSAVALVARAAAIVLEAVDAVGGGTLSAEQVPEAADRAADLLDTAARERPTWPDVERHRALVAEVRGDRSAAIGHLRRAAKAGEVIPWSLRRLSRLLVQSGRFDEAMPVIAALGDAGGPTVERLRAELAESRGDSAGALAIGAAVTPPECRDLDQLAWYARLLGRQGRVDEAVETCRRAAALAPGRPGPWLALMEIQIAAGQPDRAAATQREALGVLAGKSRERFELASIRLTGDDAAFERTLREAAAANVDDPAAGLRLAEFLGSRGNAREARGILERLTRLEGSSATPEGRAARRRLATVLGASGSQPDLREALRLLTPDGAGDGVSPENVATAASLLTSRADPASWRRGIAQLDALEAKRPLSVDERLLRARTRARLGSRSRALARDELASIAESPEGGVAVLAMLVEIALDEGDSAEVDTWLRRLRQVAPAAPGTALLEARAARLSGDDEAANRAIARLVPEESVTDTNARTMLSAASMADGAGFPAVAERVYREAAALSAEGRLRWARFLGAERRTAEALDILERTRAEVSPAALMNALVAVMVKADDGGVEENLARVDALCATILRENATAPDLGLQAAIVADVTGRGAEAVAAYRELLAGDGLAPQQRGIVAGNLAFDLSEPETAAEAATFVDRAIEELGPIPDLLDTRAMIRLAQGDTASAMEDMSDAILAPSAGRFLHLAAIHVAAGDLAAARAALADAVEQGLDRERLSAADRRRRATVEEALAGDR